MLRYTDYDIVFREIPRRDDARRQPRGMPQPLPGLPQPAVAGADRRTAHRGGRGAAAGALRRCGHLLLPDGRRRRTARGSAAGALRPPAAARPAHGVVLRTCGVARRVRSDGSFRLRETRPLHRCAGAARRSGDQPAAMAHPARRPARRSHAAVLAQTRLKNRSGRALLSPITSDPVSAADRPSSNGRRCCDRLRTDAPRAAEQRTNRRENRAIRKKMLTFTPCFTGFDARRLCVRRPVTKTEFYVIQSVKREERNHFRRAQRAVDRMEGSRTRRRGGRRDRADQYPRVAAHGNAQRTGGQMQRSGHRGRRHVGGRSGTPRGRGDEALRRAVRLRAPLDRHVAQRAQGPHLRRPGLRLPAKDARHIGHFVPQDDPGAAQEGRPARVGVRSWR